MGELNAIDPFNPVYHVIRALNICTIGRFDTSLEWSRSAYEKYPDVPQSKLYYAYFLACNDCKEKSYAVFDRLIADEAGTIFAPLGSFLKYSFQGNREEALDSLPEDIKIKMRRDPEWSWLIADAYALIGEKEESLNWLECIVNLDFMNYPLLSQHDPSLVSIRGEERFRKLMERVKSSWENFHI